MGDIDVIVTVLNTVVSAALALVLAWAVMTHRVRDGVIIKLGLICMSIGLGVTAAELVDGITCSDLLPLNRAGLLLYLGLWVVGVGYGLHLRAGRSWRDLVAIGHRDDQVRG
jgi:hypothetical protein